MPYDAHKNLAYSTILVGPSPLLTGDTITVATGEGAYFPTPPFNATVWPTGQIPLNSNAEIVRVTAINGDEFTITRAQEGTTAQSILVGYQIANTITAKTLTDIEDSATGLALGETSTTAYRGDRGKTAYDHSQLTSGNPHNVTKSDVGLGNVDNTSDANKPVSTAAQTALDAKQDLDSDLTAIAGLTPSNDDVIQRKAGAWTNRTPSQLKTDLSLSKSDVGLGNVDNTSDANKPVSTAQQTAIDAKVADAINDGTTTVAPSQNAVYDAFATKLGSGYLTGSVPYRVDGLSNWFAALNAATAASPIDVVVIGDSLHALGSVYGPTSAGYFEQYLNQQLGVAYPTTMPSGVYGQADYSPTATYTDGTTSTTALGGFGSTLTNGQVLYHTANCTGVTIAYRTDPSYGTLTVRDGAGGTVLGTINAAATAKSGNVVTYTGLTAGSHTIHITSSGTNRVEYIHPDYGHKVRVWNMSHSGYRSNQYSSNSYLALDLIDTLETAGTLKLVIIATGANDDGGSGYSTDFPVLVSAVGSHTTADRVIWFPYISTGGAFPISEYTAARTTAYAQGLPVIDASTVISTAPGLDGTHQDLWQKRMTALQEVAVLGGDPLGVLIRQLHDVNRGGLTIPSIYGTNVELATVSALLAAFFSMPGPGITMSDGTSSSVNIAFKANKKISVSNGEGVIEGNLSPAINAQTGTSYTLVLADAGKIITRSNASSSTQTLPQNSSVAIPIGTIIPIINLGAGLVTFAAGTGATVNGMTSIKQYQFALMVKTATNTWNVSSGVFEHDQLAGLSDDDHTQYALLAGRSGGQSLNGGTSSSDDLKLYANTASYAVGNTGRIRPQERIDFSDITGAPSGLTPLISYNPTVSAPGEASASLLGFSFAPQVNRDTAQGLSFSPAFYAAHRDEITAAGLTDNAYYWAIGSFMFNKQVINYDTGTGTTGLLAGYVAAPQALRESGKTGTRTLTSLTAYNAFITPFFSYHVGDGMTVTTARGFHAQNPTIGALTNGVITTNIGVDVDSMTSGGTDIGVRVAKADTYSLQMSDTGGTAAGGITFGTDTTLYRSAADTLKTDDKFVIGAPGTSAGSAATIDGSQTLTNKSVDLANNTLTGTTAQFNTALSDNDFATQAGSETLTNKTLTTPTIASFTNATHNHQNSAGGGQLDHGAALTGLTDDDHTQYALLAGRSGGQTLKGGTATSDDLNIYANNNSYAAANTGRVKFNERVDFNAVNALSGSLDSLVSHTGTITTTGLAAPALAAVNFQPTVSRDTAGSLSLSMAMYAAQKDQVSTAGLTDNVYFWNIGVFAFNKQTINYDTGTGTTPFIMGVASGVQLFRESGKTGTRTVTRADAYNAWTTPFLNHHVGTGYTLTTACGYHAQNPVINGGTITTNVGVDVDALSGATTNIGIRNASPYVATPSTAQNITAVGNTILANAEVVQLTANNSYTLTSAPTIANGVDGQLLTIVNVDSTDVITLQDQGTLASSNLRLSATTIALGPLDSIQLMYSSTVGDWIQIGQTNVL